MLKPLEVTRQIIASRVALSLASMSMKTGGSYADLHKAVQREHDTLVCLLEESPDDAHWKIKGLIAQADELLAKLVN